MNHKFCFAALALTAMMGSAQVATAAEDSTMLWGYYQGNSVSDLNGVGVSAAATYEVAMLVPGNGSLNGATIQSINLPINSKTNMKDVSVWVAQPDGQMTRISEKTVETSQLTNSSFNTIVLDNPVTISGNLYVGATFTISKASTNADKYPILFDPSCMDDESLLLNYNMGSGFSGWYDYTSQFGASALQINVSGVNISAYNASFSPMAQCFSMPGKSYTYKATVVSSATEAVENIEYEIELDGVRETRTAEVAIPAGLERKGEIMVDVVGPAEVGGYTIKMNITKVNGNENAAADKVTESSLSNVERLATRRTVVEEFTGTGCPWCSRGLLGMDLLKKTYPDTFVGIGIHQYNSSDPMYYSAYPRFGMNSAPSCIIDRKEIMDPFFGTTSKAPWICYDFERYNSEFAAVEIEMTAYWQEGNDYTGTNIKVDLSATTTALLEGDYTIDFVLTADSLHNTSSSAWRQGNNYASYTQSQVPEELYPIVKGGEYGSSYFYYPFDDVLIASSYSNASTNKAEALGHMAYGESVTREYTLSLPTKTSLLNTIKACSLDKIHGIVIVSDAQGYVANAMRVKVVNHDGSGIQQVEADKAVNEQSYDLQGRETNSNKGLVVRGGKVIFNN